MNLDNSVQGVMFRLRRGIGDPDKNIQGYKSHALGLYGQLTKSSRGQVATTLGKRNGVPDGAEQDMFQMQRRVMSHGTRRPFHSNHMADIAPTIYNGNINILAGTGGAPLAFALDDESELHQRLYSEGIRGSNMNPLSARFAMTSRENRELPVQGGATDIMRRELAADEDDKETMARKLHSGYLGKNTPFLTSETPLDPEVQAFLDQHRPPTRSDFNGMNTKFQATVNKIGNNVSQHLNNIQGQLGGLSAGGVLLNRNVSSQGGQLRKIHKTLNKHGRKFDALATASQSQRAGQPTSAASSRRSRQPTRPSSPVQASVAVSQNISPVVPVRRSGRLAGVAPVPPGSPRPSFTSPRRI